MTMLEQTDLCETIARECCFICGGRGSGKSRLGMWLTEQLLASGFSVKVLDSSRQWIKHSSVPHYVKVKLPVETNYFAYWDLPNLWNCVYDCSRLNTIQLRELACGMMASDFQEWVQLDEQGFNLRGCYILEECQNLVPNGSLRSRDYREISRYITQGRNFNLSYIMITQRLAIVDVNLVELSGLRFFGKLEGHNNTRKAKAWVNFDLLKASRDFKAGTFIKQFGNETEVFKVPYFDNSVGRTPQEYFDRPQEQPKTWWQKLVDGWRGKQ